MLKATEKEERRRSQPEQSDTLNTFCQRIQKKDREEMTRQPWKNYSNTQLKRSVTRTLGTVRLSQLSVFLPVCACQGKLWPQKVLPVAALLFTVERLWLKHPTVKVLWGKKIRGKWVFTQSELFSWLRSHKLLCCEDDYCYLHYHARRLYVFH